jgi:hypothetical protein
MVSGLVKEVWHDGQDHPPPHPRCPQGFDDDGVTEGSGGSQEGGCGNVDDLVNRCGDRSRRILNDLRRDCRKLLR